MQLIIPEGRGELVLLYLTSLFFHLEPLNAQLTLDSSIGAILLMAGTCAIYLMEIAQIANIDLRMV